ncbi:hypothetical protein SG0102_20140 [Intestinibaculum porci]|uniref:Uncharacterized protein n=1 Tax=Intestinibaculum porci TaxID=2487118 RepID=A0A3G9J7N2_9FIRM|nr:hypothetical protein SG0102_20140 [Intestinibaculum porci]
MKYYESPIKRSIIGIWQESKKKALVRSDNTTESIQCLEKYKKWLGFIDSFKVKVYSNVNNR